MHGEFAHLMSSNISIHKFDLQLHHESPWRKIEGRRALLAQETKLLIVSCSFESFWNINRRIFILFNNNSRLVWVLLKENKRKIEARCMVGSFEIWLGIRVRLWIVDRFWRIEMKMQVGNVDVVEVSFWKTEKGTAEFCGLVVRKVELVGKVGLQFSHLHYVIVQSARREKRTPHAWRYLTQLPSWFEWGHKPPQ
jgi:hypothetical protein